MTRMGPAARAGTAPQEASQDPLRLVTGAEAVHDELEWNLPRLRSRILGTAGWDSGNIKLSILGGLAGEQQAKHIPPQLAGRRLINISASKKMQPLFQTCRESVGTVNITCSPCTSRWRAPQSPVRWPS